MTKQNHTTAVIVVVMHNFVAVEELRAMLDLCSVHVVTITIRFATGNTDRRDSGVTVG